MALLQTFRNQYTKQVIPDSDKSLLKYLAIDDGKEVSLTLKIAGYISSVVKPLVIKFPITIYKNVPKTLDKLFDFDNRIYEYYLFILAYNQYLESQKNKKFSKMNITYEFKMDDCELNFITAILPISEIAKT